MKHLNLPTFVRGALAVPAAALMLGAAEASSTVALNFQSWYYDSGTVPQTVGFGKGYQTTGFPVTAKAFGVAVADWANTDPLDSQTPTAVSGLAVKGLTLGINATNLWQSGLIAPGIAGPSPGVGWGTNFPANWLDGSVVRTLVTPGNYEVTWSYLDNTGWSFSLGGLNAKFPSGYVVALIGGNKTTATSSVAITETAGAAALGSVTFNVLTDNLGIGVSPTLSNNAITLTNPARPDPANCALAGFIVTDKPVITYSGSPASKIAAGESITFTGIAAGVGTLSYQWQRNGVDIPGNDAKNASYTLNAATPADSGSYTLVVTSSLFPAEPATGDAQNLTVLAPVAVAWDATPGTAGAQDGSGTWNSVTTNWWTGAGNVDWFYTNPATFGSGGTGAYTVTLAENLTAGGGITFNSGSYTIAPAAAQTLTLAGTAPVTANANAIISANVAGSAGFTKAGTGRLTLAGTNNPITGPVVVNAGILDISQGGGGSSLTVNAGATVVTTVSNAIGYNTNCHVLNVNGGTFALGVENDGIWQMDTTLANATLTAVAGARWSFGGDSKIANSGTSSISGGTFVLREGNPEDILPITNSGNLTFNSPITGNGRSLSIDGTGTTTFAAATTDILDTTVKGGTLAVTGSLTGGKLFLNDGTVLGVKAAGPAPAVSSTTYMVVGNNPSSPSGTNIVNFSGLTSTTVAPVTAANLYLDNPITINIQGVAPFVGRYPLMTTEGSFTHNGVNLGTLPSGIVGTLVDDLETTGAIYLDVTAVTIPSIKWTGAVASGLWDIGGTANWTPSNYADGNLVLFDDSAPGTKSVVLGTVVKPTAVTFANETIDYTLGGGGAISGTSSLTKSGAGTVTISTTNTHTGGTSIVGGKLVLLNTGSGSILNDATLEISTTAAPLSYGSSITGSGTLIKSGASTLTVTGGLALTHLITAAAGTLEVQAKTGDAPYEILSGATLKLGYGTAGGYANTNLKIHGDGTTATTGLYLAGGTRYNVSGTLELLDGPTTLRQYGTGVASFGIFDINSTGLLCRAAASGSATDANVSFIGMGYGMSVNIEAGAATATGDFILNGPLDVDVVDFGLYKRGAGSLRLNSAATANNKGVIIDAGTILCGAAECLGTNATLNMKTGAKLDLNGFNQTVPALFFGTERQAAGTWGATNSGATHIDDTRFTGSGILTVITAPSGGFASWIADPAFGLAEADRGPGADPDNDGIKNLMEYVLSGNPGVSDSGILPQAGTTATDLVFTFTRSEESANDTTQVFQYSADLASWTTVNITPPTAAQVTLGTPAAGLQTVTVTIPRSAETGGKLFGRLTVTAP